MEQGLRCWAEINLDNLRENLRVIRGRLKENCRLMVVVKANAYGHGDREISLRLGEMGADWLAVATFQEAEGLRLAGVALPVLILGYTSPELAPELVRLGLTQTVFSAGYAKELAAHAKKNDPVEVHLKVDTGMHRLGLDPAGAESLQSAVDVYQTPGLRCSGIFTHFAVADEPEPESEAITRGQFRLFMEFLDGLARRGIDPGLRHCCNSAATLRYPEMHLDLVRCGIAAYGLLPAPALGAAAELRPVMSLRSRVVQLRWVPAGDGVSYGRIYVAPEPRLIAAVSIGYADGYARQLGGLASALVRGAAAPVVGRVCMDQMMLDVTDIAGVREGDIVTLAGADGGAEVTFDRLAALTGTIHYERVCAVSPRVPRYYLRDRRPESSSERHR